MRSGTQRERWRMGGWGEPLTAEQATGVVAGGGSGGNGGAVDLVRAAVSVAELPPSCPPPELAVAPAAAAAAAEWTCAVANSLNGRAGTAAAMLLDQRRQ